MKNLPYPLGGEEKSVGTGESCLREAFRKKTVKLGTSTFPNLLTGFKKNKKYSECPETHKKHIKHFSIFRGDRSDT